MGFGNRTSTSSKSDSTPAKTGGFKSKAGGFKKSNGPVEWIGLGSITASKKLLEENELYGEICDALDGSEFSFSLKIYLGKDPDATIALKNGDFVTLKFKKSDKDPDYVLGRASLKVEE